MTMPFPRRPHHPRRAANQVAGAVLLLCICVAFPSAPAANGSAPQSDAPESRGADRSSRNSSRRSRRTPSAERGYRLLRTKEYLPPDFDDEVFDALWKVWPAPLRRKAEQATPQQRREMAFTRYGLVEPPEDGYGDARALGYVDDGNGGWVMNCLACHTGRVAGQVIPGAPNTHYDLQTLTEDVRLTKIRQGKAFTHMDLGSLKMPLATSRGTTNAVMFGVALGVLRAPDMEVTHGRPTPKLVHHDVDPPALWNVKKKDRLYADSLVGKNHRVLMQFILLPRNEAETVKSWESDFRDILAWIESLEAPDYPWEVDGSLANRGKTVFEAHCSRCHGTYGQNETYPERMVSLDVVGTDPVRLNALTRPARRRLAESWMSYHGEDRVELDPAGYVAPPLDGVWASAPYFHNGSVPTLWHVLHPDERPVVWKRPVGGGYDRRKVGLKVKIFDEMPPSVSTRSERRRFYETTDFSKSAAGHRFPKALTEEQKRAVLEYLKTL